MGGGGGSGPPVSPSVSAHDNNFCEVSLQFDYWSGIRGVLNLEGKREGMDRRNDDRSREWLQKLNAEETIKTFKYLDKG